MICTLIESRLGLNDDETWRQNLPIDDTGCEFVSLGTGSTAYVLGTTIQKTQEFGPV